MKICILNGINTNSGGSGSNSLSLWVSSFKKKNYEVDIINSVPNSKNKFINKIYLFIYFIPGSFFRILPFCISEYFIKLNFYDIFFIKKKKLNYKKIILSHHSLFYLGFLFKGLDAIIHDLIFLKSKNKKTNKLITKIYLKFELIVLRNFNHIYVQSYYEYRILKKLLPDKKIYLIESYKLSKKNFGVNNNNQKKIKELKNIILAADWRRKENYLSLILFMIKSKNKKINFKIYGYSNFIFKKIIFILTKIYKNFTFIGRYKNTKDLNEDIIMSVSIFGAGIELKIMEHLSEGKIVICSKKSLQGYHIKCKKLPVLKLKNLYDFSSYEVLQYINKNICKNTFNKFYINYKAEYKNLADCI